MLMESMRPWKNKLLGITIAVIVSFPSQLHFSVECLARGPHTSWSVACGSGVRAVAGLGMCGNEGQVVHVSNDIDCDQQAQEMRAVGSASGSVGTSRFACASIGGNFAWDNLERGQPPGDN